MHSVRKDIPDILIDELAKNVLKEFFKIVAVRYLDYFTTI